MTRTEALHAIATETGTLSPRELALEFRRLTGARSVIIDFDPDTFAGLVARAKREGVSLGVLARQHLTQLVEQEAE